MNRNAVLTLKRLLTGNVSEKVVYYIIDYFCVLAHTAYMIIFLIIGIPSLFVLNIASIILYVSIGLLIHKKKSTGLLVATFIEVCVHSVIATLVVGWQCGFYLLLIILIPLLFFCDFNNASTPYIYSIITIALFFILRIFTYKIPMIQEKEIYESIASGFYLMNSLICFSALLLFSVISYKTNKYVKSQLIKENTELKTVVNFDPLTGLLNRRSMLNILTDNERKRATGAYDFCLILADIDDFKKINDQYGHDCGDYVLTTLARILTDSVKPKDAVCRWGGEEILILVTDAGKEKATVTAEAIRLAVENYKFEYNDMHFSITLTLGVSSDNIAIHDMMIQADQYLYFGKNHGKNMVVS